MGFTLRCAIAKVENDAEAERVATTMIAVFPAFVKVRRFVSKFRGVIAGHDPEDADIELAWIIEERLPELSQRLGALPVAYINVDCFGGTCMYDGHILRDGATVHVEAFSSSAHLRLFTHLGVSDPESYFAPFTRGFMTTGVAGAGPGAAR